MKNCKNCGASAPSLSSSYSYVCEYCSTKNVDDEYFKQVALTADLGKSDRHAQLGINAYVSDQFDVAEKHFETSVLEYDKNAQVWIYLALCKACLLTASNFDKHIKAINDAIYRANEIDSNSEVVKLGHVAIFEKLTLKIANISDYFFHTAYKSYVALGKNKDGANEALPDLLRGVQRIHVLSNYHVTDSHDYTGLLIDGLEQCIIYEQKGAASSALKEAMTLLENEVLKIFDKNQDLVKRTLEERGEVGKSVTRLLNKSRPDSFSLPHKQKKSIGFLSKFFT
jgi:tetratricopeptide (TPR) repeat protein